MRSSAACCSSSHRRRLSCLQRSVTAPSCPASGPASWEPVKRASPPQGQTPSSRRRTVRRPMTGSTPASLPAQRPAWEVLKLWLNGQIRGTLEWFGNALGWVDQMCKLAKAKRKRNVTNRKLCIFFLQKFYLKSKQKRQRKQKRERGGERESYLLASSLFPKCL